MWVYIIVNGMYNVCPVDLSSDTALSLIAVVSTHYDIIMISLPFLVQVFEQVVKGLS